MPHGLSILQALNLFTMVEICYIAMIFVDLVGEELIDILLLSYGDMPIILQCRIRKPYNTQPS